MDSYSPSAFAIVNMGHPALRHPARPLEQSEIADPRFQDLLRLMEATLDRAFGVGLAAPQIGVGLQVFITRIPASCEDRYVRCTASPLEVWINPRFEVVDGSLLGGIEGCLSIPRYVGRVERPSRIRVEALDRQGARVERVLDGWNARVFQHEYDHLQGVLYTDKLATDGRGHPEMYEENVWKGLETEKRAADAVSWLEARGLLA